VVTVSPPPQSRVPFQTYHHIHKAEYHSKHITTFTKPNTIPNISPHSQSRIPFQTYHHIHKAEYHSKHITTFTKPFFYSDMNRAPVLPLWSRFFGILLVWVSTLPISDERLVQGISSALRSSRGGDFFWVCNAEIESSWTENDLESGDGT
jgi:hypothetical protein